MEGCSTSPTHPVIGFVDACGSKLRVDRPTIGVSRGANVPSRRLLIIIVTGRRSNSKACGHPRAALPLLPRDTCHCAGGLILTGGRVEPQIRPKSDGPNIGVYSVKLITSVEALALPNQTTGRGGDTSHHALLDARWYIRFVGIPYHIALKNVVILRQEYTAGIVPPPKCITNVPWLTYSSVAWRCLYVRGTWSVVTPA